MNDWWIESDEETAAIEAVYDLRDMHIDASIVDDMDAALLANLLIEPAELGNECDEDVW